MNSNLINHLDSLETLLVEEYNSLGEECTLAFKNGTADQYDATQEQRSKVKTLLHQVREFLREMAPDLYPDF